MATRIAEILQLKLSFYSGSFSTVFIYWELSFCQYQILKIWQIIENVEKALGTV